MRQRQQSADQYPPRDPRINQAWNRLLQSRARRELAKALDACFRCKCAYCEQVAAKDIEHFYPKGEYPRKMFRWVNLLRGCKNCNNAKRDRFPLQGSQPVLLNPCEDEPLNYFVWSFETGAMGVNPDPLKGQRATTTCDMFSLNQEPYREERRNKFKLVVYLLARVVNEDPVSDETKEQLHAELAPTRPWLGIIRQLLRRPDQYQKLIKVACQKVPEIGSWTSEWL
ncbi:MAG: TIGR02646 family protein [Phycisphaerae bacterium]|nr:TIGR02646 family protein [Phycisphaerae bacterium]